MDEATRWYVDSDLSHDRLLSLFQYEAETGKLFRRQTRAWNAAAGSEAGTTVGSGRGGHLKVSIGRGRYLTHRLIWFYVKGTWPRGGLDHINGDPTDNRIENLREADQTQNNANSRKAVDNKSGFKGVSFSAHARRWRASITYKGRGKNLGYFDDPRLAHEAYLKAARELFGEFARAS